MNIHNRLMHIAIAIMLCSAFTAEAGKKKSNPNPDFAEHPYTDTNPSPSDAPRMKLKAAAEGAEAAAKKAADLVETYRILSADSSLSTIQQTVYTKAVTNAVQAAQAAQEKSNAARAAYDEAVKEATVKAPAHTNASPCDATIAKLKAAAISAANDAKDALDKAQAYEAKTLRPSSFVVHKAAYKAAVELAEAKAIAATKAQEAYDAAFNLSIRGDLAQIANMLGDTDNTDAGQTELAQATVAATVAAKEATLNYAKIARAAVQGAEQTEFARKAAVAEAAAKEAARNAYEASIKKDSIAIHEPEISTADAREMAADYAKAQELLQVHQNSSSIVPDDEPQPDMRFSWDDDDDAIFQRAEPANEGALNSIKLDDDDEADEDSDDDGDSCDTAKTILEAATITISWEDSLREDEELRGVMQSKRDGSVIFVGKPTTSDSRADADFELAAKHALFDEDNSDTDDVDEDDVDEQLDGAIPANVWDELLAQHEAAKSFPETLAYTNAKYRAVAASQAALGQPVSDDAIAAAATITAYELTKPASKAENFLLGFVKNPTHYVAEDSDVTAKVLMLLKKQSQTAVDEIDMLNFLKLQQKTRNSLSTIARRGVPITDQGVEDFAQTFVLEYMHTWKKIAQTEKYNILQKHQLTNEAETYKRVTATKLPDGTSRVVTEHPGHACVALDLKTPSVSSEKKSCHRCLGWSCDCSNPPGEDVMNTWGHEGCKIHNELGGNHNSRNVHSLDDGMDWGSNGGNDHSHSDASGDL